MPPPVARVDPVQDTHFGVTIDDPYRWMEQQPAEFESWLDGQAAYASERLGTLPHRSALLARIQNLGAGVPQLSDFALAGDRVFYLREDRHLAVPVLVTRLAAADGTERVLLDPNAIAGPAHSNLDWYVPAPDGRHVACGIALGGSENATLRVIDVDTGALLDDAIGNVRLPFVSWLADGRSLLYHRYLDLPAGTASAQRRLDSRSGLHRLGTDPARDPVVLARGVNPRVPLAPVDRPLLYRPPGTDWVVAIVSHKAMRGHRIDDRLSDCTLYLAPVSGLADPAGCPWERVADPADRVSAFAVGADVIYLVSARDADRRQVLAVPLGEPSPAQPTVLVRESDRVVETVRIAGDRLLIRDLADGVARLRQVPLAGGEPAEVALPMAGTILEWAGTPDSPTVLLRMESWTEAPQVYRYDAGSGAITGTEWAAPTPAGFADIETYQVRATARDGTPIPISVIHRRGLVRDGDNPTLLSGYGSYGISFDPRFRPGMLAWLERGGVWAVAHIRGGGEYGDGWHEAGWQLRKENTITDFLDCAEHLVGHGYTRPARLAGEGTSAGGIPTGGALVRRPDLWAAMVLRVPFVNALRAEFGENGPINVPEFGSVDSEEGLRSLLIVDCYQRVQDGTPYPAALFTAGRNDPRVPAWQPAKMTARLQAATSSDRPVLLRVERHGGHGFGSTAEQRDAELAYELAFLFDQFS
jgi:prolyl oligopeptidase